MRISSFFAKVKFFRAIFLASPKVWSWPKAAEVVIYDASGSECILPYLSSNIVSVLCIRGESINVACLLHAALKLKFWKAKFLEAYSESFISAVSPKLVITFIDNNPAFYRLSNLFPKIKTISIQNGARSKSGDIFDFLSRDNLFHVDYMLVHSAAIGKLYSTCISGQSIAIGSLKNNMVSKSSKLVDNTIVFVSQWQSRPANGAPFYIEFDGTPVFWDAFYEAEVKVLSFLAKWCNYNKKKLQICGRTGVDDALERDFFASFLNNCSWEFMPRKNVYSSYLLIDAAEIVVYIDSTLGYESVARSNKTACFSCRNFRTHDKSTGFGWPADLPNNGPFWTNNQDEAQFQRVMDFLKTVGDKEWEQTLQLHSSDLMNFDSGNTRLISLLDQLLNV